MDEDTPDTTLARRLQSDRLRLDVSQLQPFEEQLPQILALGLREFSAIPQEGFSGLAEVLEFLASLPTESAIIALRPSEALQAQLSILLRKIGPWV